MDRLLDNEIECGTAVVHHRVCEFVCKPLGILFAFLPAVKDSCLVGQPVINEEDNSWLASTILCSCDGLRDRSWVTQVWRWREKTHASSPSSSGKSHEKLSVSSSGRQQCTNQMNPSWAILHIFYLFLKAILLLFLNRYRDMITNKKWKQRRNRNQNEDANKIK